ncbi:unnamed protein product [Rhodiola kirilowii]
MFTSLSFHCFFISLLLHSICLLHHLLSRSSCNLQSAICNLQSAIRFLILARAQSVECSKNTISSEEEGFNS